MLVRLLKARGINAVAATTTKIYIDDQHKKQIVFSQSETACLEAVRQAAAVAVPTVICAGIDPEHPAKALGIPATWLDEASRNASDSTFIVEGDGSAGKSLKGHLAYEPVIPALSKLVIPVAGLDVLGKSIGDSVIHRTSRFCELTGASPGEVITERMVADVLAHPDGYLQHVPLQATVIPLLNKAENSGNLKSALKICRQLAAKQHSPIRSVVIGSIHHSCWNIRILEY